MLSDWSYAIYNLFGFTFKDPNHLECYYCFGHAGTEHDDCDVDEYGEKVVCQMHDPREPNYGDVCFVGHTGLIMFYSFTLLFRLYLLLNS